MVKKTSPPSPLLAFALGLVISMIAPVFIYACFVFHLFENQTSVLIAAGVSWVVSVLIFIRTILAWEHGAHIIQRTEEGGLLNLFSFVHDDLVSFNQYMENFLRKEYGKGSTQILFLVNFINDSSFGLSKVIFNPDLKTYSTPPYNDLVLPRNDSTAVLFSEERHVLNKQFLAEINVLTSSPVPGDIVFPLINDARGLLGLWCITLPNRKPNDAEAPDMVLAMGRYILENLVTNHELRRKHANDGKDSHTTVISYQQIVNLVNVVLHEVATPISVIRNTVSMMRKGIALTPQQIDQVDEMTIRLQRRMAKMAAYANTIGGKDANDTEGRTVENILENLKDGITKNNLATIAQERGKRIRVEILPDDLRTRVVNCSEVASKALWEIMENAITYSPAQSVIYLRISSLTRPNQSGAIRFHFLNKGHIPDEVLETYKHVGTAQDLMKHGSNNKGIGIGLALAFVAITRGAGSMAVSNQDDMVAVEVYLSEVA